MERPKLGISREMWWWHQTICNKGHRTRTDEKLAENGKKERQMEYLHMENERLTTTEPTNWKINAAFSERMFSVNLNYISAMNVSTIHLSDGFFNRSNSNSISNGSHFWSLCEGRGMNLYFCILYFSRFNLTQIRQIVSTSICLGIQHKKNSHTLADLWRVIEIFVRNIVFPVID